MTSKTMTRDVVVTVVPMVIVLLMQKPALRQAIKIKCVEMARNVAIAQTEFWRETSFELARLYDRVRM